MSGIAIFANVVNQRKMDSYEKASRYFCLPIFIFHFFCFFAARAWRCYSAVNELFDRSLAHRKSKAYSDDSRVKDACVNEMQLLTMLPAELRASLTAEIDSGLAQHLAE